MEPVENSEFPRDGAKISAPLRVLVVDDEPLIRWSVSETLSDLGYVVVETGDAYGARAAVAGGVPFDVVLLDYRLPDSDDLGLLSSIRQAAPEAQVIMMTAFGNQDMIGGALALGAYRVINKPFELRSMAALVAEAAGHSAAH